MSNAADAFPLDDDDILTDLDGQPYRGSFVDLVPREEDFTDRLRLGAQALARDVHDVERTCLAFSLCDPSAEAAELALRRCVGRMTVLASAFGNVCAFVVSASHRELFVRQTGLLEPYLLSVRLWADDVTQTLGCLAGELNTLTPDWDAFRASLRDVEWVYARAAEEQARLAGVADTLPADIRAALGELFVALRALKRSLDERFG